MFYFYDVLIIGGGHAGIEAAVSSSRIGAKTCILTNSTSDFGKLSCNPYIGGIAKSNIIKEIDFLSGLISKSCDYSGIHFKVLNSSKGTAVWGSRSQVDRIQYSDSMNKHLYDYINIDIIFDEVRDVLIYNNKVHGVITNNIKIYS